MVNLLLRGLGWVTNPVPGNTIGSEADACYDGNSFNAVTLTGRKCRCDWWKHKWHNEYPCPNTGNTDLVLIFEDDFDGTELNTDFWEIGYGWGGEISTSASFAGVPFQANQNVFVQNGELHLKTISQIVPPHQYGSGSPAKRYEYTSGSITSNMHFGYGVYEIRCKMPANPKSMNSAFWLYGGCDDEIDVFETFEDGNKKKSCD